MTGIDRREILPDPRHGLNKKQRAMRYGRVLELVDIGQHEFQATLARLLVR